MADNKRLEINQEDLKRANALLKLPQELIEEYINNGYGFFDSGDEYAINRLLDPQSLLDLNLRTGIYENDPDLELYDELYRGKEILLFFEENEGVYLSIELGNSPNRIFRFEEIIANSLDEFLSSFHG